MGYDYILKCTKTSNDILENTEFDCLLDDLKYYERRFSETMQSKRETLDRLEISEDWYLIKEQILKLIRRMNGFKEDDSHNQ